MLRAIRHDERLEAADRAGLEPGPHGLGPAEEQVGLGDVHLEEGRRQVADAGHHRGVGGVDARGAEAVERPDAGPRPVVDADDLVVGQGAVDEGDGGVDIGSISRRLLYAWELQEPRFLLSDQINEDSQLLYNRNVRDRVQEVAPFLTV